MMPIRRLAPAAAITLAVTMALAAPAWAAWTATGTFMYMDREFDETGFTGVESPLPVRRADVEIVDANSSGKNSVLGTGVTNLDGTFSINVSDNQTRDVYARVVTRSDNSSDLNIDVRVSSSGKAANYAAASATVTGHPPSMNLSFGVSVIDIGQGGEAFNLYDQMVRGVEYLTYLNGFPPSSNQHLATVWGLNNGIVSSYYSPSSTMIFARDSSGYDDTVILHEMGHYVIREYSQASSSGGAHTFSLCFLDIRLAFDEGWATYWGNSVLRYIGYPKSNIYTRTNGGLGPGHLVRYADLETDTQYLCKGSTNELVVSMLLWDIVDGPSTPDTTPGVDDAQDFLDLDDHSIWKVMTDQLPGSLSVSLETFWDGWFTSPVLNGHRAEMIAIGDAVGVEYHEDAFEENDVPYSAIRVSTNGVAVHATIFSDPEHDGAGAPDVDDFSFDTVAGGEYTLTTSNLLGDGNTYLRLYDSDGTTLLALNNDQASGDDSSKLVWTAPYGGVFYAQISHAPDYGMYGAYDFTIHGPDSAPPGTETVPPTSGGGGGGGGDDGGLGDKFLPTHGGGNR